MSLQAPPIGEEPRTDKEKKPPRLGRVVTASFVGTTIEYYDFFIYGTAAALVFPTVFFAALGETAALAASLATFAVAFVARPLGGIIFGYVGDRVGRKASLVATLVLMGVATVGIGLIPGGDAIGIAAPILLITLRFCQGLAVGGEWASAALFVGEFAPRNKRARFALGPSLGTTTGQLLSTLTFLIVGLTLSPEDFLAWGWRIPFLLSVVLVVVGLIIRLGLTETPVFKAAVAAADGQRMKRTPIADLFRLQWREVLLGAGTVVMWLSFFYLGAVFLTGYVTGRGYVAQEQILTINLISIGTMFVFTILGALFADKFGRRAVMIATAGLAAVWAFVLWPLIDTGALIAIAIAVIVTMSIVGAANATTTAFLPEVFQTRFRATGTGVSFNLGSIIGGAIPPIIAAPLIAASGSIALSIVMAGLALISLVSAVLLRETRGRALDDDIVPAPQPATASTGE